MNDSYDINVNWHYQCHLIITMIIRVMNITILITIDYNNAVLMIMIIKFIYNLYVTNLNKTYCLIHENIWKDSIETNSKSSLVN